MFLSELKPTQKAHVTSLSGDDSICRRLLDIGLTKDAKVECIGKSPCGDPKAYLIRGAVIAIRKDDAKKVHIRGFD